MEIVLGCSRKLDEEVDEPEWWASPPRLTVCLKLDGVEYEAYLETAEADALQATITHLLRDADQ